ncbi:4Fe-4S binding protein [Dehalobacter sp. DCM]|uniref:DUF362 domain-containing protein n=1 Tax=Dehalobacter sp. DCM TaxID=2907827 RepID=UPI003081E66E|nr:4Fe-4S binding protein [Dehalobacter sp. DCM]
MAVIIDKALCTGCALCARECPNQAIMMKDKKAVILENCSSCGICTRVCSKGAAMKMADINEGAVKCTSCPVQCEVPAGFVGACQRYRNEGGQLIRNRQLVTDTAPGGPLITAVGAGTNYPCCKPAPYIVQDTVDGVEMVTVVTEAPLSYSGVKVKIDTNLHIGEEGAKVKRNGKVVGMVDMEEYGSKMLTIGGANLLTGKDGFIVARTVVEIANSERVTLKVDDNVLELQVGFPPIINGVEDRKMRVGCGSATIGMFAARLKEAADEVIILDYHIVGLLSEHMAGEAVGLNWSGVTPNARRSTRGRYFGEHGHGWGGTDIEDPKDAIKSIDMSLAKAGMTILVTETTGRMAALFEIQNDGSVKEIPMTTEAQDAVDTIRDTSENARVSALYVGGTGGSARAGVAVNPARVTQAVHDGDAVLTIGGAKTFVLPGGGINFMVDVEKVVPKAFTWVPTPATVAPVEYTMPLDKYQKIGGHIDAIKKRSEIINQPE